MRSRGKKRTWVRLQKPGLLRLTRLQHLRPWRTRTGGGNMGIGHLTTAPLSVAVHVKDEDKLLCELHSKLAQKDDGCYEAVAVTPLLLEYAPCCTATCSMVRCSLKGITILTPGASCLGKQRVAVWSVQNCCPCSWHCCEAVWWIAGPGGMNETNRNCEPRAKVNDSQFAWRPFGDSGKTRLAVSRRL